MITYPFDLKKIHGSWLPCIKKGLAQVNHDYLQTLQETAGWLPGPANLFNAFSLPMDQVNYVLFGESPYPRQVSANGYAFWDADVKELWAPAGLSKKVNRATSLRNIIKMLLVADGKLNPSETTQDAISQLDKQSMIQTNADLFNNLLSHGFLLLNATLVLNKNAPAQDAREWMPFLKVILECLLEKKPDVTFILLGRIAITIDKIIPHVNNKLCAEHPYNLSFITNPRIIEFFRPLQLLAPYRSNFNLSTGGP